jgi:hypothetical protein
MSKDEQVKKYVAPLAEELPVITQQMKQHAQSYIYTDKLINDLIIEHDGLVDDIQLFEQDEGHMDYERREHVQKLWRRIERERRGLQYIAVEFIDMFIAANPEYIFK